MPRNPRPQVIGATHEPDVRDEELEAWTPEPLGVGFVIEDARLSAMADFVGLDASRGRIACSRLEGVRMAGSRLRSLRLKDVVLSELDASNADWTRAQLTRVVFEGCRMTGFGGIELEADSVVFRNCKLDLANFRTSTLRRTTFEDCVLDEADFAGGTIEATRFAGSRLLGTRFDKARLSQVDFRGSDFRPRGDLSALGGAIIDSVQLVDLAGMLAQAIGIVVEDPEGSIQA